jgi:uncharacterized protein YjbI with pentapeptide repeats
MTFTLTDYLLLLSGGLSFAILVWLIFLKQKIKKTFSYKSFRFNNQKIYNLGRFCLAILSFCLTVLSGNQLFQTSNPLILLICSFFAITSLQIFWWNLTYNSQEDPLSSLFLKKEQRLDLRKAYLRKADLRWADLSRANLREADLREAFLREAYLSGADLSWADLRGADLSGADLRGADLSGADLRGADLSRANLRGAELIAANLSEANLRGAELIAAKLIAADLSAANLREANLTGAYLRGASLFAANLRGANLGDSPKVQNAHFTNTKGLSPEQRAILIARGAIFTDFP